MQVEDSGKNKTVNSIGTVEKEELEVTIHKKDNSHEHKNGIKNGHSKKEDITTPKAKDLHKDTPFA